MERLFTKEAATSWFQTGWEESTPPTAIDYPSHLKVMQNSLDALVAQVSRSPWSPACALCEVKDLANGNIFLAFYHSFHSLYNTKAGVRILGRYLAYVCPQCKVGYEGEALLMMDRSWEELWAKKGATTVRMRTGATDTPYERIEDGRCPNCGKSRAFLAYWRGVKGP